MFCVYIFQHKQNHKIYVGKAKSFSYRLSKHKQSAKNPKTYFNKALAKYGLDAFNYFIIEEWENETDCLEAEMFWIAFFNSNYLELGYNLTEGGDGSSGYKHTPEAIAKMRIINKTKNLGQKHRSDSIELMSSRQLKNHDNNSLMNLGENNPNSKLNKNQVLEILDLLNQGELTLAELSKKFVVSRSQIEKIKYGKSWKSIPRI